MSNRLSSTSPDYNAVGGLGKSFDDSFGVQVAAASGAITIKEGTVFITKAGIAAMTLAAPTAGLQSAGGDDGRELTIISNSAYAHTITTPANVIDGNKTVNTFNGTLPNACLLIAYQGSWMVAYNTGGTLS